MNFVSDFLVFHSSSSSTFLNTYSYHYSAEINIESNSITSSLILYHYVYKILGAIQSYRFFVINLARKGVIVALEINQKGNGVIVARLNQLGKLMARKSSISTQRNEILEGVPRSLEIESVIVQFLLKGNPYLCCGTGCRVTPNQYKIRCVLSFTAFILFLRLCLFL